jgi:hypothetical protein
MANENKAKQKIVLGICLLILLALNLNRLSCHRIDVPDEISAMGSALGAQIASDLPGGERVGVILPPALDRVAEADQSAFVNGVQQGAGGTFTVASSSEKLESTGADAIFEMRTRRPEDWLNRLKEAFDELGACDAAVIEIPRQQMPHPRDLDSFPPLYLVDPAGNMSWKAYLDAGVLRAVITPIFDDDPTPPHSRREDGYFLTTPAKKHIGVSP